MPVNKILALVDDVNKTTMTKLVQSKNQMNGLRQIQTDLAVWTDHQEDGDQNLNRTTLEIEGNFIH